MNIVLIHNAFFSGGVKRARSRRVQEILVSVVLVLVSISCQGSNHELSLLPPPESALNDKAAITLAYAAKAGNIEKLDELLSSSASLNANHGNGITPFAYAVYNLQAFKYLLARGANPNAMIGDFSTILHVATGKKDIEFLRSALEYGADPDIRTRELGETPLFAISGEDASTRIKMLISAGADINALSDADETPLISHARAQRYDVVLALMEHGADFHVRTDAGWSITKAIDVSREHYGSNREQQRRIAQVMRFLLRSCETYETLICEEVREIDSGN